MGYQSNALVNSLQPARLANRQQGIGRHFFRWIDWADSLIREAVVACMLARAQANSPGRTFRLAILRAGHASIAALGTYVAFSAPSGIAAN
jgi:hypothetical protein